MRNVTGRDCRAAFDVAALAASNHPPTRVLDTVIITVRADAFLRGMMRSFTGALVKIGQGPRDAASGSVAASTTRPVATLA